MTTNGAFQEEVELDAFEAFASAYPHEAYDEWPDAFWAFFQRVRPGVSHEDMVRLLNETREASVGEGA